MKIRSRGSRHLYLILTILLGAIASAVGIGMAAAIVLLRPNHDANSLQVTSPRVTSPQVASLQVASLQLGGPASASAGDMFTVTVTAQDAQGKTASGYTGTVHFTSSDALAVLPANYAFTSTDKGAHTFSVTLTTVGSQTVTATDTVTGSISGSAAVSVSATTGTSYYVSTTGSDSSAGTLAAPFRTIAHALTLLKPGDTLYIRGGTYAEALINDIPSGTSWNAPVTISAYGSEVVTLEAPSTSSYPIKMHGSYQYIIISHIIFDAVNLPRDSSGRGAVGVYISSDSSAGIPTHLRFTGCEIKNAPASGLLVEAAAGAPSDIQILNCSMHDNGANILDHGIYISGNNVLVDHCRIYNNQGFGVQIYDGTTNSSSVCSNNVISNNIIYGNARYNSGGAGIIVDTGDNNVVYNNVIYNNNNGYGIRVDAQAKGTLIYNNTVTGNPGGALLIGYDDNTTSGTVVRNNILYHNGSNDIINYGTGTIADHNTLNSTDPLFVDAANNNYQVQAGSPAIDAGLTLSLVTTDINGKSRPAGSYTIGAYQYAT